MKNSLKLIGIIALTAVIGFSMAACKNPSGTIIIDPGETEEPEEITESEDPTLDEIGIQIMPVKTAYHKGEDLDLSGLELRAYYNDSTYKTIDIGEVTVSGFDSVTGGNKLITVGFGGKTKTFGVKVFYTVKFDVMGGNWGAGLTEIPPVDAVSDNKVSKPINPSKKFHNFTDWCTKEGSTWNFSSQVADDITLYAGWELIPFSDNMDDITEYLKNQPNGYNKIVPVHLPINIAFEKITTDARWKNLLNAIDAANKFVILDLSGSTLDFNLFDPDNSFAGGKDKIVTLILPDTATTILGGNASEGAFKYFTSLYKISGAGIEAIHEHSFYNCTSLRQIELSAKLKNIYSYAFYGCINLYKVICNASNVPALGINVFLSTHDSLEILVPLNMVGAYQTDAKWKIYTITGK